jgi:hypothetical protein
MAKIDRITAAESIGVSTATAVKLANTSVIEIRRAIVDGELPVIVQGASKGKKYTVLLDSLRA